MPHTLKDRVALVTGGSRGIGRAISVALAAAGAAVAVNYRERKSEAESVVAEIERAAGRAIAVRADVSLGDEVRAMIAEVSARLGAIDVLVNNAGTATILDIEALTEAEFDRTLAVNLKSAFCAPKRRCRACGNDGGAELSTCPRLRRAVRAWWVSTTTPPKRAWKD